jgi:preprotein translocase SecE subunit
LEKIVAEKDSKATKLAGNKKKADLLKREVNLSGSGKLSRKVRLPRWIRAIGGYFGGSWRELREVSWPTRKATWGMTLAVMLFTLVLAVIILLLDLGFEQLFKRIIL